MPQGSYTQSFLNQLGMNTPKLPATTPEMLANWEALQQREQSQWPKWKQNIQSGMEGATGALTGFLGLSDFSNEGPVSTIDRGNMLGQLLSSINPEALALKGAGILKSGLPFAAVRKASSLGKKVEPVYHGTQKVFSKFDPDTADVADVLGKFTHFAESPRYAESYASGSMKGPKQVDLDSPDPVSKQELQSIYSGAVHPNMIPAHIEAENVLDLISPTLEDTTTAIAGLDPMDRAGVIDLFKHYRRKGLSPDKILEGVGPSIRRAIEKSDAFDRMPFDAIRYLDSQHPSWAVPPTTGIKTPWGTPLRDVNKLQVNPIDQPLGGMLQKMPESWTNPNPSLSKASDPNLNWLSATGKHTENDIKDMLKNNVISTEEANYLLKNINADQPFSEKELAELKKLGYF